MNDQTKRLAKIVTVLTPIIGGVILQLAFWPNFGSADMLFFIKYVESLRLYGVSHGFLYGYQILDYPPLSALWLYPATWFAYDQLWSVAQKALPIKFILGVFYYLFFLGILHYYRKLHTVSWLENFTSNARFLFNIALMESAIILSYVDIFLAPLLLATFYYAYKKKYFWSGCFLAATFMTKLVPIFALPAFIIYFFTKLPRQRFQFDWKHFLLFGIGLSAVSGLTLWYFDYETIKYIIINSNLHGSTLSHAYNFNRIVALIIADNTTPHGIYIFNRILFFASAGLLLIKLFLSPKNIQMLLYACLGIFLSYFVWFSGVHENHLFPALIIVIVLMLHQSSPLNTFLYYTITVIVFMNLFIPYGFGYEAQHGYYLGLRFFSTQLNTNQLDLIITAISYCTVIFQIWYVAKIVRLRNPESLS